VFSHFSITFIFIDFLFQIAQGASVPSLGLSNKAVDYSGDESGYNKRSEKDRHVKDQVRFKG
jgi:hypothetical protein